MCIRCVRVSTARSMREYSYNLLQLLAKGMINVQDKEYVVETFPFVQNQVSQAIDRFEQAVNELENVPETDIIGRTKIAALVKLYRQDVKSLRDAANQKMTKYVVDEKNPVGFRAATEEEQNDSIGKTVGGVN